MDKPAAVSLWYAADKPDDTLCWLYGESRQYKVARF
jgi:hypothetical protein